MDYEADPVYFISPTMQSTSPQIHRFLTLSELDSGLSTHSLNNFLPLSWHASEELSIEIKSYQMFPSYRGTLVHAQEDAITRDLVCVKISGSAYFFVISNPRDCPDGIRGVRVSVISRFQKSIRPIRGDRITPTENKLSSNSGSAVAERENFATELRLKEKLGMGLKPDLPLLTTYMWDKSVI
ncbi:hypothetical protein RND71_034458 [Anisodus tanguticus]|uniref:Uncharacterized protein n=1 Tax=Anisodus tanguticus TaxID=243964 RepID=A0AAE1R9L7_9SOLA|nr:hypothetical protein RND71_034458 [Anisodus tanguticus]